MNAISETLRITEWRALLTQYPTTFTWDGDDYVGRLTDARGYNLDPVSGGFIQGQTATLFVLNEDFTGGMPGEGDILRIVGLGWRVMAIKRVMSFGTEFQLEGPDKR